MRLFGGQAVLVSFTQSLASCRLPSFSFVYRSHSNFLYVFGVRQGNVLTTPSPWASILELGERPGTGSVVRLAPDLQEGKQLGVLTASCPENIQDYWPARLVVWQRCPVVLPLVDIWSEVSMLVTALVGAKTWTHYGRSLLRP